MSDTDTIEQPPAARVARLEARNARLQEALRAAGLEIDSLSYAIAHDLRTPLMHIDGFAQLLQSSPAAVLDHASREHLGRIIAATRTMNEQLGLSHEGHQMIEARDGLDGLQSARAAHPDLVISDILMPSMDGFEFVRLALSRDGSAQSR